MEGSYQILSVLTVCMLYPLQGSRSTGCCVLWEVFVMSASSQSGLVSLTVNSLVCSKLTVSKIYGAKIKIRH